MKHITILMKHLPGKYVLSTAESKSFTESSQTMRSTAMLMSFSAESASHHRNAHHLSVVHHLFQNHYNHPDPHFSPCQKHPNVKFVGILSVLHYL